LLLEGRSSIGELPPERFDQTLYYDPQVGAYGKSYCRLGGWVEDEPFNADAFGLSAADAQVLDPLHRWVLEVARDTLTHAGLEPEAVRGANIGVVLGHSRGSLRGSDAALATVAAALLEHLDEVECLRDWPAERRKRIKQSVIDQARASDPSQFCKGEPLFRASNTSAVVARVFGLTGRHLIVDAACASSLAAIDIAARAIRQGSLDMALVGGAAFSSPLSMVFFSQARALSADGSFPFDARANGFISSEGVGMLLLARLEDAVEKALPIHGLIHGIGGSCDGHGKGLWAPNKKGQVLALENAYAGSSVDPGHVDYIEAHGTSTALGDATEFEALSEFFGPRLPEGVRLPIGSVKSNLGHCREAAGVAGVLKVLIGFEHDTIPASINHCQPNAEINWSQSPLYVAHEAQAWPRNGRPRLAGIDSFGIGGLNFHVVLEEAPASERVRELLGQKAPLHTGSAAAAASSDGNAEPSKAPARGKGNLAKAHPTEPIAIVGIGCLLPGSRGPQEFWERLCAGHVALGEVPAERWAAGTYYRNGKSNPWQTYCKRGGFIADFAPDWRRYRMPPKLVEHCDPLQLMLLDCALEAIADAKIDPASVDRRRIAVVVGSMFGSDYALDMSLGVRAPEVGRLLDDVLQQDGVSLEQAARAADELVRQIRGRLPDVNEDSAASVSSSTLASRIATALDLHGATFAVDSAAASSLVALDVACESLSAGSCDVALWGGADRGMSIQRFVDGCRAGNLSTSELSAPFDAASDGHLLGEGIVVCVLKRECDARTAGDRIYAVVRGVGSATAFDPALPAPGSTALKKNGTPSPAPGLLQAAQRAHARTSVDADSIGYVEAVGIGTARRDAAVLAATRAMLSTTDRKQPLFLGSVQANIGYTQGAAGAAAIVKTALALKHGSLPPTPGVQSPSTKLEPDLKLCTALRSFPVLNGRARGSVTCTVPGGVNYHVILEAAANGAPHGDDTHAATRESESWAQEPFLVRGRSRADVAAAIARLVEEMPEALAPGTVRGRGPVTVGLRPGSGAGDRLALALKALSSANASFTVPGAGVVVTDYTLPDDTCFMFPGQGSQYPEMLRKVAETYDSAADVLGQIDDLLTRFGHPPLTQILWHEPDKLNEPLWTQMAALGAGLAMLEVARAHHLTPSMITGHSYGDYPALVAAGAWSLEQVVLTTVLRYESVMAGGSEGGMAAIFADRAKISELLKDLPGFIAESNINAPDEVVVSGEPQALDGLLERCQQAGVTARRLRVPKPFHCELMRGAAEIVSKSIGYVELAAPRVPFLSSVGARVISDPDELRVALTTQLTLPVNFISQIETAYAAGCRRFVEVGAGSILTRLATRILAGRPAVVVSLDDKKSQGLESIESALAVLRAHDLDPPSHSGGIATGAAAPAHLPPSLPAAQAAAGGIRPGEVRFVDATQDRTTRNSKSVQDAISRPQTSERPPVNGSAPRGTKTGEGANSPSSPLRLEIEERLVDVACEQSGYPRDLILLDSDLEADLGIDTVKQMHILGKIREIYDLRADERLALRDMPTLRLLADHVERALGAAPAERAAGLTADETPKSVPPLEPLNDIALPSRATNVRQVSPGELVAIAESPAPQERPDMPLQPLDVWQLESRAEAAHRWVLRTENEALPELEQDNYRPDRLVILGMGPVAERLRARLESRGTRVEIVDLSENPATFDERCQTLFNSAPLPDVCLLSGIARLSAGPANLEQLAREIGVHRRQLIEQPFRALQCWVRHLHAHPPAEGQPRPTISAVTAMGGALGTWNVAHCLPEGGAIAGLCKALRREFPELRFKLLDVEPGEQPVAIVDALLADLDSDDQRLEVGLLRGQRLVSRMIPAAVHVDPQRLDMLRGLPYVILTGGARGITAEIALRLAQAGVRRFHLIGKMPLPPELDEWRTLDADGLERLRQDTLENLRRERANVSPAQWEAAFEPVLKALEIDRNLARLKAAGALAVYHAVDVADGAALEAVLNAIRAADGPIEAIVHAAGYQHSRAFASKKNAEMSATLAPKLDGTLNLMRCTENDPLRLFVSFSSVAGRLGGLGQTDYSLACEMLARLTAALAAARPACRAVTLSWPAWADVGMAAHRKTRHLLEARKRRFMSIAEGCDHFMREILAADGEMEVVLCADVEKLDLDAQTPSPEAAQLLRSTSALARSYPLVDGVLAAAPAHITVECRLDADRDPFLTEHRMGSTSILPAVIALEMFAETALLASAGQRIEALENVSIVTGIRLGEVRRLAVRCEASGNESAVDLTLRGPQLGRKSQLLDLDRTYVVGRARLGTTPLAPSVPRMKRPRVTHPFVYGQHAAATPHAAAWHHGHVLQGLKEIAIGKGAAHWGRIEGLSSTPLRPLRAQAQWWLPAAVLDSCLAACAQIVRTKMASEGLPRAFGRLSVGRHPEAGEVCELAICQRGCDERDVTFDFTLYGADGAAVLAVERYVVRTYLTFAPGIVASMDASVEQSEEQPC